MAEPQPEQMSDSKDDARKPSPGFSMFPCQAFQPFHSAIPSLTSSSSLSSSSYLEITSYILAGHLFPFQRFLKILRNGEWCPLTTGGCSGLLCGLLLPSHNFSPGCGSPQTPQKLPVSQCAHSFTLPSPFMTPLHPVLDIDHLLNAWVEQTFISGQNRSA